ncbi:uncharacterized protein BKCO1_3600015 [Diplodia corticola]|uniref:MARVEL domain-containing protein n=1 Tax=Diplodia corticola TaxID=236234 RepID=A0A1J9QWB4_9PEZI|nr:uncharacterized protein BKCO1_3600015 [Diplodia corticola]OJD32720.1 hypothetical protein BKCO1_3600015 [Diplodia corticola]
MPRLLGTRQSAMAVPPWFSALPAAQLVFAVLVLGLTAYALSAHSESQIRPSLVLTITTAVLTILLIFPVTIPIPAMAIHPLGTLIANFIGILLWLASLVALASYLRIFSYYRKVERIPWAPGAPHIAAAWRCGVAACVFAAIELLLFLATFKLFGYFYHHHRAGTQPHKGLLHSTSRMPRSDAVPLESTSDNVTGAGGLNQYQPAPAATHPQQQQQQHHHNSLANTISPPVSPLQPTAPVPSTSNHANDGDGGDINHNGNVPSITHTAATPTAATNPHLPAAGNAFATISPGRPPQRHANPIIPDPGASGGDNNRVTGRPPYPLDDEEMGAVSKSHHQRGGTTLTPGVAPVPPVSTAGASER